jgi:hypothetical protein
VEEQPFPLDHKQVNLYSNGKMRSLGEVEEISELLALTLQKLNLQARCVFSEERVREIKESDEVVEVIFKTPRSIKTSQWVKPEKREHIKTENGYRILENVKVVLFILEDKLNEGLGGHVLIGQEVGGKKAYTCWAIQQGNKLDKTWVDEIKKILKEIAFEAEKLLGANVRLNTFTSDSDYYPEAFDQLVLLNCNVVRLTGANKAGWFQLKREFKEEMLEDFLREADKRGIKTIFLLSDMWAHIKPPYSREEVAQIKKMIDEVVVPHVGDRRILMWDVWNEPDLADENVYETVKEIAFYVKERDPTHPITIGGWRLQRPGDGKKIIDLVDYHSPHIYVWKSQFKEVNLSEGEVYNLVYNHYRDLIARHRAVAKEKPLILQEFGISTQVRRWINESFPNLMDDFEVWYYKAALDAIRDSKLEGALFWAYLPGNVIPGSMHSVVNADLTWKKSAYVISRYYGSGMRIETDVLPDESTPKTPSTATTQNCDPPAAGDWVIEGKVVCRNEFIVMNGNVTVKGELELLNSTLMFNDQKRSFSLEAMEGAALVINSSRIDSLGKDNHYSIFIHPNTKFILLNSIIANAGSKDPEKWRDYPKGTREYYEYNRYLWILADYTLDSPLYSKDGIIINTTVTQFRDNTFLNVTRVRFYSSNNIVENNRFIGMKHEGLAFMLGSDNNIVRDNYFGYAARMNREINALRFYYGGKNQQIYNNTFEWVPRAVLVCEIPPWCAGENFTVHDNVIKNSITGFVGKLTRSHIYNENYTHLYSTGLQLEATSHTLVENSSFTDVTFQELENVINQSYYNECHNRYKENGERVIRHIGYWTFTFYSSKPLMTLVWSGNNITIKNNYFGYTPPWGWAINLDQSRGIRKLYIVNNTFERIGNYVPEGFIVKRAATGSNRLDNILGIVGGAIGLEGSTEVFIENNTFRDVLNGIVTAGPDAMGNFGSFVIKNNELFGVWNFTWQEQRRYSGWWQGSYNTTKRGIGIGFGVHYAAGYGWNSPRTSLVHQTFISEATQVVENNSVYNFVYPLVIDYRRDQPHSDELGAKHAIVANNRFAVFDEIVILDDGAGPNTINMSDNSMDWEMKY